MNNERYNQIIDEAYENYLKNFVTPICPPNLDVQPDYYMPMTREWFAKSAKERGLRGEEFSERWGLKIEERELSQWERVKMFEQKTNTDISFFPVFTETLTFHKIPTKLIKVTYKNETIEVYE